VPTVPAADADFGLVAATAPIAIATPDSLLLLLVGVLLPSTSHRLAEQILELHPHFRRSGQRTKVDKVLATKLLLAVAFGEMLVNQPVNVRGSPAQKKSSST
jgi:hypothetical protein